MTDPRVGPFNSGDEGGAIIQLSDSSLSGSNVGLARMGVSWSGVDKACAFAGSEVPGVDSAQFDATRTAATSVWDATLGTVQIDTDGASDEHVELFWSSLYRAYISPTNITGDNPLYDSSEPYYDSLYCIWDSVRYSSLIELAAYCSAQFRVVRRLCIQKPSLDDLV